MRIAEVSSPEIRQQHQQSDHHDYNHKRVLSQLESLIKQTENSSSHHLPPETLPSDLRQTLSHLPPFSNNSQKLHIWKLSYRLWNSCVDLSNAASISTSSSSSFPPDFLPKLRHVAADLLFLASDVAGVPSPATKTASFYFKTGQIWHDLKKFDLASSCFEKATEIVSKLDVNRISDSGEKKLLLDINIARSRTAWEVLDRNLAITLLNRAKCLLFGLFEHYKSLANQYLAFAKNVLSKSENSSLNEALKLMMEALDLSEKGLAEAKTREETIQLKGLKTKTLRFISAVHLQKGEFESVLKCVRVLREGSFGDDGGDHHASLPVLAMKGWLGLGRFDEAEKELRGMVALKGIPEGIWVSAVEAYFQAAGTAGAETAKGVFLGLLGRCHVSAKAAVRVAHRVVGDTGDGFGEGSAKVRAKVVAELVSDERVMALFAGDVVAKERTAMHAVLWNFASNHFRMKDYETSAEMFEKSMLYLPFDMKNRILRAKSFRVLCLCYLGLSQLDRAQEYIIEAERLEPNIASAFLKFKIYLQKNDHNGAIDQILAMKNCLDFTPDFLSLSAHEAVACRALPVAVASLSSLLNFYTSGTAKMPITEVVVLRTLVTILAEDTGNRSEVLKYMKRAHTRASELGPDYFFGKEEAGRREQNWFSVMSWNLGTKCGKEKNYELCVEFLRLASEFFGILVGGQVEESSVMVCKSLILSVSAMIASENQKQTALLDTEVKQAVELLDRAGKILISLSSKIMEPDLFFIYTFNAYDIQGRLNNSGSQQQLVKNFAISKACNPKYLLQIGLAASQGPRSNPQVAIFALNECLSALLSSPSPDFQNVSLTVRKLIALASIHKSETEDDAVHGMYKQAYRIMVGLKEGEYPSEEGKWLAMTAWNRAAVPVRLGQIDLAKKWMNVGLELARQVAGMETYRACMEDFISSFEKKCQEDIQYRQKQA